MFSPQALSDQPFSTNALIMAITGDFKMPSTPEVRFVAAGRFLAPSARRKLTADR